jgi:hypothetical protein
MPGFPKAAQFIRDHLHSIGFRETMREPSVSRKNLHIRDGNGQDQWYIWLRRKNSVWPCLNMEAILKVRFWCGCKAFWALAGFWIPKGRFGLFGIAGRIWGRCVGPLQQNGG